METKIVSRVLKNRAPMRVLVIVTEAEWQLPKKSQHEVFYCTQTQEMTFRGRQSLLVNVNELPILPESIDFLVLPHVMRKEYELKGLIQGFNQILKADGYVLFFGANDYKQYCADEIQDALKAKRYRILNHRGYHMLPFLGETFGELFDRCIGQFFPWMGVAYWLLAQKNVVAMNPLRVPKWKKINKPLDANEVRPAVGRESQS